MDLEDLRNQVRMVLPPEVTDISDSNLDTLINQGILEVATAFQWTWLEASATVSAVDSQQNYSLPNDFHYGAALVDDDNDMNVPYMSPTDFFQEFGNDTGNESTTPQFWTIWEDEIWLTPIPSANDSDRFTLYYYKQPTTLAADDDTPEFDSSFHQILVEYCKYKLLSRGEYWEQVQQALAFFSLYLEQMKVWYSRKTKRTPYIAGDGTFHRAPYDPNIPFLRQV